MAFRIHLLLAILELHFDNDILICFEKQVTRRRLRQRNVEERLLKQSEDSPEVSWVDVSKTSSFWVVEEPLQLGDRFATERCFRDFGEFFEVDVGECVVLDLRSVQEG